MMGTIQGDTSGGKSPQSKSRKRPEGASRKGGGKAGLVCGLLVLGLAAASGTAYAFEAGKYEDTYFPNTIINGIDASGKTVDEMKELIQIGLSGYKLTVEGREGVEEEIFGADIGLHPEYDGSLEQILAVQEPLLWGLHLTEDAAYSIETMVAFDQESLETAVSSLACMDETAMRAPVDAKVSDYINGTGYEIIPEEPGTQLIPEVVLQGVADGIRNMQDKVSLEELGAYRPAEVTADNPELNARAQAWNQYVNMTVTYQFGENQEVLDGEIIHTWLTADDQGMPMVDDQGNPVIDETLVTEYVAELGRRYNTAYKPKTLKTTYGPSVTITGGNYGWRINQKKEAEALLEIVRSGQSQQREPVYIQTAASHGENDYGDTYVEINLTAQHLYFYKNGTLVVDSDFVSGNVARGYTTPPGAFPLTYKQRNAVLKGQGYASPVSYWMPFNGGIGMHDANWRGSFGGKIYRTNGSHGCVNLPVAAARTIYGEIEAGMPVLCYNLEGTSGAAVAASPETVPGGAAAGGGTAPAVPAAAPAQTAPAVPATASAGAAAAPAVPETAAAAPEETPPASQAVPETVPDPAQSQGGGNSVITAETADSMGGPGTQTTPAPQETPQTSAAPPPAPLPETVPDPYSVSVPQNTPSASPGGPGSSSGGGNGAVSAPGM